MAAFVKRDMRGRVRHTGVARLGELPRMQGRPALMPQIPVSPPCQPGWARARMAAGRTGRATRRREGRSDRGPGPSVCGGQASQGTVMRNPERKPQAGIKWVAHRDHRPAVPSAAVFQSTNILVGSRRPGMRRGLSVAVRAVPGIRGVVGADLRGQTGWRASAKQGHGDGRRGLRRSVSRARVPQTL